MITVDDIRVALSAHETQRAPFSADNSHAAVAMIVTDDLVEPEVCFIRRAERDGDPWSGQVAFPGGRADAVDPHAAAVAERETWEEIGLRLNAEQQIGALPIRPIERRDVRTSMTLSPFVYAVPSTVKSIASPQQSEEVASVFWVPMGHLFDPSAATDLEYAMGGNMMTFPGIQFEDHIIWGLTLRILSSFAEIMGHELAVEC